MSRIPEPKEEVIEEKILTFLLSEWVSVEKKITKGFFDEKRGFYRKNKSQFARNGSSDIHGTIPPYGRGIYIEVKKPSEMAFFDRTVEELQEEVYQATYVKKSKTSSGQKKMIQRAIHALEQKVYIEEKKKVGAVAFFASGIEEVKARCKPFDVVFE